MKLISKRKIAIFLQLKMLRLEFLKIMKEKSNN